MDEIQLLQTVELSPSTVAPAVVERIRERVAQEIDPSAPSTLDSFGYEGDKVFRRHRSLVAAVVILVIAGVVSVSVLFLRPNNETMVDTSTDPTSTPAPRAPVIPPVPEDGLPFVEPTQIGTVTWPGGSTEVWVSVTNDIGSAGFPPLATPTERRLCLQLRGTNGGGSGCESASPFTPITALKVGGSDDISRSLHDEYSLLEIKAPGEATRLEVDFSSGEHLTVDPMRHPDLPWVGWFVFAVPSKQHITSLVASNGSGLRLDGTTQLDEFMNQRALVAPPADERWFDLLGDQVSLADFRGRPVVLALLPGQCDLCREQLAALQQVWNRSDKSVAFVAVIQRVDVSEAARFFTQEVSTSFDVGFDPQGAVLRAKEPGGWSAVEQAEPTIAIYDSSGHGRAVSPRFTSADDLSQMLTEMS